MEVEAEAEKSWRLSKKYNLVNKIKKISKLQRKKEQKEQKKRGLKMYLNNLQPKPNKTSSFVQEPFFKNAKI